MKVLDLFSGIGGFSLGLERAGMKTVAFCEIDPFCQKVLKKHWPDVPIFTDIKELNAEQLPTKPDVIAGGWPCQPFSVAGKRRGSSDDRHLWPEYLRIIRELHPRWIIGENVSGFINMELDQVLTDLEGEGYTSRAFVIPACAVDAPHRRDRVWIVANTGCQRWDRGNNGDGPTVGEGRSVQVEGSGARHKQGVLADPNREREPQQERLEQESGGWSCNGSEDVAHTDSKGSQGHGRLCQCARERSSGPSGRPKQAEWEFEPNVGRVANGVPRRVDRLRALGNAVVPQIPEIIGRAIMEIEREKERETAHG